MGGEHDVGTLPQQLLYLGEGLVEADVGVDIDDVVVPLPQQVLHGPGFDGGVELEDGVLEQEVWPVGQVELLKCDGLKLVGELAGWCGVAVNDDAVAFGFGVVQGHALQQGTCKVQVVVADDGDDGG